MSLYKISSLSILRTRSHPENGNTYTNPQMTDKCKFLLCIVAKIDIASDTPTTWRCLKIQGMKRRLDGNEEDNCQNKKTKYQTLWHYYENIIRKANFMFAWKKPLHAWDKQMIKFGVPEVKPHHFFLSFFPSPSSFPSSTSSSLFSPPLLPPPLPLPPLSAPPPSQDVK